jgi:hypothetical protein
VDSNLVIVARQPIGKGEEVTISYMSKNPRVYEDWGRSMLREERLEVLKSEFGFRCRCYVCASDASILSQLKCPSCGGNLVPKVLSLNGENRCLGCLKTNQDLTSLLVDKRRVELLIREGVQYLGSRDFGRSKATLLEAEKLGQKVYQKNYRWFFGLKALLSRMYWEQEKPDFNLASKYLKEAMTMERVSRVGESGCEALPSLMALTGLLREKGMVTRDRNAILEANKTIEEMRFLFQDIEDMEFKTITAHELRVFSMFHVLETMSTTK